MSDMEHKNSHTSEILKEDQEALRLHFVVNLKRIIDEMSIELEELPSSETDWATIKRLIYIIWKEIRQKSNKKVADKTIANCFNFPNYDEVIHMIQRGIELNGKTSNKTLIRLPDDATQEVETFAGVKRKEATALLIALQQKEDLRLSCINQLHLKNIRVPENAPWPNILNILHKYLLNQLRDNEEMLKKVGIEAPQILDWKGLFAYCSRLYLTLLESSEKPDTKTSEKQTMLSKIQERGIVIMENVQMRLLSKVIEIDPMQSDTERVIQATNQKMDKILRFPYELIEPITICFRQNL